MSSTLPLSMYTDTDTLNLNRYLPILMSIQIQQSGVKLTP